MEPANNSMTTQPTDARALPWGQWPGARGLKNRATNMGLRAIAILLFTTNVFAADRPEWAVQGTKAEDGRFRYYVGRTVSDNEAAAFSEARQDAQLQAIRDNYGTQTQVELRALENSRSSQTLKSFDEEFPKVSFDGFEQVDAYTLPGPKGVEAWVLFRYPKTTIAREKLRLAKAPASVPDAAWSEQGNAVMARQKGAVEISTEPAGADVFIDDKQFGVTPLKLLGVLEPGQHDLRIDHPAYAVHHERFTASPEEPAKIHKKLRKALGYLSVTTAPAGAKVRIEGHPAGVSPVKKFPVSAGKAVALEITSKDAQPLTTQVTVDRDRHETRFYDLERKRVRAEASTGAREILEEKKTDNVKNTNGLLTQSGDVPADEKPFPLDRSLYTFSLLPVGYSGSPLSTVDVPHTLLGAAFLISITRAWYWELGYRFGQREVQYANALLAAKFHHLVLSTGLQATLMDRHTFGAEAVVTRLIGNYRIRPTGQLEFRSAPAISQWAFGAALRYRFLVSSDTLGLLTTGWGFGARLAGLFYQDANSVSRGKTALEGEVSCFFLF